MNFDKFVNNRVLEKFSSIHFDLQTNINNHEKQNVSLTFKVKIMWSYNTNEFKSWETEGPR